MLTISNNYKYTNRHTNANTLLESPLNKIDENHLNIMSEVTRWKYNSFDIF